MKSLKVLIISHDYPPASEGGIGSFTFELATGLANNNVITSVITRNVSLQDTITNENGVLVYRLSLPKIPLRHILFQVVNASKIMRIVRKEKPDIIHINGLSGSFLLPLLSRYAPTVVTIHGSPELLKIYFNEALLKFGFREQTRLLSWYTSNAIPEIFDFSCCDHLIFVAQHVLSECLKWKKLKTHNTTVIYNGINLQTFSEFMNCQSFFNNGIIHIAFVGRLVKYKGILLLLNAFAKFIDETKNTIKVELKIFGKGPLFGAVERRIKKLNLEKVVHLKGWISREQLLKELSRCHLLVHPSFYEACPLNVLEAYALGKPVIAHKASWSKEFVESINAGAVVDVRDQNNFSETLLRVICDKKNYDRLSKNARTAAQMIFNVQVMVKQYLHVYECLLN